MKLKSVNKLRLKINNCYKNCHFLTRLYVKIRLFLTPFEKVSEYIPREGVIYDLGCGYGLFANMLALRSPGRRVIGIDFSKERIQAAKRTVGTRKNIQFVNGNLGDVKLEGCSTIVIYDVLHHMSYKDQESLVRECHEALGPNGLLIVKDNDTSPGWKFLWNYLHEIVAMFLLITKSDKLSFRAKGSFLELFFKNGFVVEAINIPTKLPYPFILYKCRKVDEDKKGNGIVFINPPLSLQERYGAMAKGGRNAPPLGLCSLAAVVREKGYPTYIIDAPTSGYDFKEVVRKVSEIAPRYVGITASTAAIRSAARLARELKRSSSGVVILVGGPHVTALPKETLKESSEFDFGVVGEGENALIDFLSAYGSKSKGLEMVKGLVFRRGKTVVVNARGHYIKNLDDLPIPAWDLLPALGRYYRSSPQSFDRLPSTSFVTSRGCPNQCTFCDRGVFGNYLRGFSPEYVIRVLRILVHQYGIKHILFDDDTFTILKKRLEKICRLIIEEKMDLTWTCLARVDSVDEGILQLMKKAGCWQILYGIESGDQQVLDQLQKGITLEGIRKAILLTHKVGIRSKGFFILGTPFETKMTVEKTIKFMKQISLDDFHMTFFTPFPGTEIYKTQIKDGGICKERWSAMNEWEPVYVPSGFEYDELISFSKRAFREFYFRPSIVLSYLRRTVFKGNFIPLFYGANALLTYLFLDHSQDEEP